MARCALEDDFPASAVSLDAEKEAWRKEVHRPATHTHKWWAQRLGTVFRGIISSAASGTAAEAKALYEQGGAQDLLVLDPFAGSGTTLVEAAKLGCRVAGLDINPVATLVQRQALADWDPQALKAAFKEVEESVRDRVMNLYRSASGEVVLYYFWVALARCPHCPVTAPAVELFSRYVFAQHAYPKKNPLARALCPDCGHIIAVDLSSERELHCTDCGRTNNFEGAVSRSTMTCRSGHESRVIEALGGKRPEYKMYAKLVLGADGKKRYERADEHDLTLYSSCRSALLDEAEALALPTSRLEPGHNTRQAMAWGFSSWRDFFNDRQLLALGLLAGAIRDLPSSPEREALAALFSGVLEFNNLLCSYKGEGTGAVRHMFSHHILKPERTPLEANPWGTTSSSGSFSTLFHSRIARAMEYKISPHDIVAEQRKFGVSKPLTRTIVDHIPSDPTIEPDSVFIVTGTGAETGLPDSSVDLIITDPPYFDNVHYSELADFFHSWLVKISPYAGYPTTSTTRSTSEVQSADPAAFSAAIGLVWSECERILKPDGLVAFTFHHSRSEGWASLVRAIRGSSLTITAIQPVKGEMSVASPKSGARNPSNLDSVVVCRKSASAETRPDLDLVVAQLKRLKLSGTTVGWSDVQSVVHGCVMARFTAIESCEDVDTLGLQAAQSSIDAARILGVRPL